jgi:hypothetical protein
MPAERGLLQPIQCFVELHDLGPESTSQNLGLTHIHDFCQWGTHERVRDVQAVHYVVLTGSDAEDDMNDSEIGDVCVRLIEVEAMYLSISASNKAGLVLDDRTRRVSFSLSGPDVSARCSYQAVVKPWFRCLRPPAC